MPPDNTPSPRSARRTAWRHFGLLLTASTVLRLVWLITPGYDVRDYKIWAQVIFEHGLARAYSTTFPAPAPWFNYPPVHLYVLASTGAFYHALAPNGDWRDQLLAALLKLAPVAADLALGALLYTEIRRRASAGVALAGAATYLLNPAIIWNTAYWGGIDAFHALFATTALVLAAGSSVLVGPFAALALGSKLLALPELLAIVPRLARVGRVAYVAVVVASGMLAGLLLAAPIVLAGDTARMLAALFNNLGNTPVVAANAHNLWWLVTLGNGWRRDTGVVAGGISYRNAGLALWSLASLHGLWRQWQRDQTLDQLTESAAYLGFAFFMLLTEVHENWSFGLFAPLVLAAVTRPVLRPLYVALSLTAVANMALQDPPLRNWIGPGFDGTAWRLGVANAGVNVALFAWWSMRLALSKPSRPGGNAAHTRAAPKVARSAGSDGLSAESS